MADEKEIKASNQKKKFQAELVEAVKKGNFKKAAKLRVSIKNLK